MGYSIAVVGGDGTGPEVIREGLKCLRAVDDIYSLDLSFTEMDLSGDRYKSTGKLLEEEDIATLKAHDGIYLGAIGHTEVTPGILEKGILLKMRFDLDQYINYRPVRLYPNVYTPLKDKRPEDIDYVVIRENTGGLYTGVGSFEDKGTPEEVATQSMIYTRKQVERCVRFAYETAQKRRKKLTLCGKTNVLTYVYDLWERVMNELHDEYSDVEIDYVHVDAVCIYMVECPERFDVIVTGNMFGDIITDLAAVTQGGMGVAAGANINPEGLSMFEPIGGTAPNFTGLDQINPMAAIGAAHLMLDYFGETEAAKALETAKISVIQTMDSMAAGKMGMSTSEVGDRVVEALQSTTSKNV
ncbi:3-isopropylmalate dehydrogenase [bacterium]|jgi:3-isopropylmalate dehydrogenase|nr:3-isopropylmalate dehydrogenase [bacterium]